MLIASKYEEIYAPEIKDFEFITDRAYKCQEIIDLEVEMLQIVDFNVTTPSSFRFLQRYS